MKKTIEFLHIIVDCENDIHLVFSANESEDPYDISTAILCVYKENKLTTLAEQKLSIFRREKDWLLFIPSEEKTELRILGLQVSLTANSVQRIACIKVNSAEFDASFSIQQIETTSSVPF